MAKPNSNQKALQRQPRRVAGGRATIAAGQNWRSGLAPINEGDGCRPFVTVVGTVSELTWWSGGTAAGGAAMWYALYRDVGDPAGSVRLSVNNNCDRELVIDWAILAVATD